VANPIVDRLLIRVAFLVGAVVPSLPFVQVSALRGGLAGMATTALVLFAVGYGEGRLADQPYPSLAGARFLAIALGAAALGNVIGLAIAPLGWVTP
jgi:VIT1/CCC1 family predicted Fe2+/Mn2+ transporter